MELKKIFLIIDSIRKEVKELDKEDKQALQYCLNLLTSMKEMEAVVPSKKELTDIIYNRQWLIQIPNKLCAEKLAKAIRSQLLLGLAGFEERLPEIISKSKIIVFVKKVERHCAKLEKKEFDDPEDKWLSKKIEELAQVILAELKGGKK